MIVIYIYMYMMGLVQGGGVRAPTQRGSGNARDEYDPELAAPPLRARGRRILGSLPTYQLPTYEQRRASS